jgi:hypothetical protein
VDLGRCVLQLCKEVPLWRPGVQPHSYPHTKKNSEVVSTWCGRVVAAQLEGSLEFIGSLVGLGSWAIHQAGLCKLRMTVQPPREMPVAEVHHLIVDHGGRNIQS